MKNPIFPSSISLSLPDLAMSHLRPHLRLYRWRRESKPRFRRELSLVLALVRAINQSIPPGASREGSTSEVPLLSKAGSVQNKSLACPSWVKDVDIAYQGCRHSLVEPNN
uniref:Uncharacterized protein n=1 Tax=Picea glauca TaxID=3330 RepID=A0A101M333_PICGL|nr:hypothetical protein ABT39_MTgene3163 [Picea glauca]QHR89053.1 hypothetical protein Q903MT_gene3072 [Picea sitchensis]